MNQLTEALHIPDTQSGRDERHLVIQRVGVKDVRYPLQLRVAGAVQSTSALWNLDVALPAEKKGTHMSRLVAWLDALDEPLTLGVLRERHAEMLDKLQASEGRIEAAFSFFIRKRAPVSGVSSLLDYQGRWVAETRAGVTSIWAEVGVPVKSLCPCSKEISDYGAHNQRSLVTIRVELPASVVAKLWCWAKPYLYRHAYSSSDRILFRTVTMSISIPSGKMAPMIWTWTSSSSIGAARSGSKPAHTWQCTHAACRMPRVARPWRSAQSVQRNSRCRSPIGDLRQW